MCPRLEGIVNPPSSTCWRSLVRTTLPAFPSVHRAEALSWSSPGCSQRKAPLYCTAPAMCLGMSLCVAEVKGDALSS